jgi:hypothetical protein
MDDDEALALIHKLEGNGTHIRRRGRHLEIERGVEALTARLQAIIAANWEQIAYAVSARKQAARLIRQLSANANRQATHS